MLYSSEACPARTSWEGRDERIVRVIDDRAPVWRVNAAEFAQAWKLATREIVVETYNKLKGRVD